MSKYFSIFKTSFKQESKSIVNSFVAVISFAVIIYIFYQLWKFIYGGSGGGNLINGYSIEMMIWYLIMAEILAFSLNPKATTKVFGEDIKFGAIAYKLVKPYNYFGYQIASQCASFVWKLCFLLPVGFVMGVVLLGPLPIFSVLYLIPIIISVFLACFVTCILYGTIGLLCFWIEETTPLTWRL